MSLGGFGKTKVKVENLDDILREESVMRAQSQSAASAAGGKKPKNYTIREAFRLAAAELGEVLDNEKLEGFIHTMASGKIAPGKADLFQLAVKYANTPKTGGSAIKRGMDASHRAKLSWIEKARYDGAVENMANEGYIKGTAESKAWYGDSIKKANADQLARRLNIGGYVGRGRYDERMNGTGDFFDSLLSGLKLAGQVLLDPVVGAGAQVLNTFAPGLGTALQPVALMAGHKLLGSGEYTTEGEPILLSMNPATDEPVAITTPSLAEIGAGAVPSNAVVQPRQQLGMIRKREAETDWNSDNPAAKFARLDDMRAPIPKYDRKTETTITNGRLRFSKNVVDTDRVQFNNIVNHGSHNSRVPPRIRSVGDETADLVFTHNEYLRDVTSLKSDFHTAAFIEINPALARSFPLLSRFASKYSEYDFIQCIFHFKSLVTDGNSAAAGSVMLAPSYNPADPPLTDKRGVENSEGAVSDKVTCDLVCGIECDNEKVAYGGLKYSRTVDVDPIGRRQYDMGSLQIALQGVPPGLVIGELWCSYQVRLSKLRVQQSDPLALSDGLSLAISGIRPVAIGTNVVADVSKPRRINIFAQPTVDQDNDPVIVHKNLAPDFNLTHMSSDQEIAAFPLGDRLRPNCGFIEFEMAIVGGSQYEAIFEIPFIWDPNSPGWTDATQARTAIESMMLRGGPTNDQKVVIPIFENVRSTVQSRLVSEKREYFVSYWPAPGENTCFFTNRITLTFTLDNPGAQGTLSGRLGLNILDGYCAPVTGINFRPFVLSIDPKARTTSHFTMIRVK